MGVATEASAVSAPHFNVRFGLALLTSCVLALASSHRANAITINFSNLADTDISFASSQFTFSSDDGYQFSITGVTGGLGDSVNLEGYVNPGGPFTIGAVTINGTTESAPVTGTGILHITDADDVDLTGSLQWENIETQGIGGILNLTGLVNLTSITYPSNLSSDPSVDLETLANGGSASDIVTFQFVPAMPLTSLVTTGGSTSYSGSISNNSSSVPEPTAIAILGLAGIGTMARRGGQIVK
jgi:hypothetical protein